MRIRHTKGLMFKRIEELGNRMKTELWQVLVADNDKTLMWRRLLKEFRKVYNIQVELFWKKFVSGNKSAEPVGDKITINYLLLNLWTVLKLYTNR